MAEKNVDLHKHTHKHTQTHTNTHKQTEKVVQGTLPPRTRSKMKLFFLRKPRKKRLKRCALRAPHYNPHDTGIIPDVSSDRPAEYPPPLGLHRDKMSINSSSDDHGMGHTKPPGLLGKKTCPKCETTQGDARHSRRMILRTCNFVRSS